MKQIFIFSVLILIVTSAALAQTKTEVEFKEKASQLFKDAKYTEYIKLLDEALPLFPNNRLNLLKSKLEALDKVELIKEAVLIHEEIYSLYPEIGKRILAAAEIAWRHMECNDLENCYKWAKISAELGYQKFGFYLDNDVFKPLQNDKRFNSLIAQIKQNAGIGKSVKPFICTDIQGKEISLEKYKGKVVLVDFWATWCPPCIAEIPNLKKLLSENKDNRFEIIGISYDADRAQLDKFLSVNNLPWPTINAQKGAEDEISKIFNTKLVPSCYLIDRNGILRYVQVKGDALSKAVSELMNE